MAYSSVDQMSNLKPSYWNKHGWTEAKVRRSLSEIRCEIMLLQDCKSPLVVEDIHSRRRYEKLLQMALDSHLLRNPPRGWNP